MYRLKSTIFFLHFIVHGIAKIIDPIINAQFNHLNSYNGRHGNAKSPSCIVNVKVDQKCQRKVYTGTVVNCKQYHDGDCHMQVN